MTTRLNEHELEIVKNIETARHFQDMVNSEGWKRFIEIKNQRLDQIKYQLFTARVDKEKLWDMQLRLNGIIEFLDELFGGIDTAVETLDPKIIQAYVDQDFGGELGLVPLPEEK